MADDENTAGFAKVVGVSVGTAVSAGLVVVHLATTIMSARAAITNMDTG